MASKENPGLRFLLLAVALASLGICLLFEIALNLPLPLRVYLAMGAVFLVSWALLFARSVFHWRSLFSAGLFLLLLTLFYWIPWSPRKTFLRTFGKLQPGMTAQEVEKIMGGYEFSEVGSGALRFRHSLNDPRFSSDFGEVYFQAGKVTKTEFLPD